MDIPDEDLIYIPTERKSTMDRLVLEEGFTPEGLVTLTDSFGTKVEFRAFKRPISKRWHWKEFALWLANVHCGTIGYEMNLKSVSKSRKERYYGILQKIKAGLELRLSERPTDINFLKRRVDEDLEALGEMLKEGK